MAKKALKRRYFVQVCKKICFGGNLFANKAIKRIILRVFPYFSAKKSSKSDYGVEGSEKTIFNTIGLEILQFIEYFGQKICFCQEKNVKNYYFV